MTEFKTIKKEFVTAQNKEIQRKQAQEQQDENYKNLIESDTLTPKERKAINQKSRNEKRHLYGIHGARWINKNKDKVKEKLSEMSSIQQAKREVKAIIPTQEQEQPQEQSKLDKQRINKAVVLRQTSHERIDVREWQEIQQRKAELNQKYKLWEDKE